MDRLPSLGWDAALEAASLPHRAEGLVPGRVIEAQKDGYTVALARNDHPARLAGRLRHALSSRLDLPTVGDFVAVDAVAAGEATTVRAVLPRRSLLARKAAGRTSEPQALAANVDVALLATAASADFAPRRLERYLALVREAGVDPVVVLTKADLHPAVADLRRRAMAVAPGVPVVAVSALGGTGLEDLAACLGPAMTGVLIGSSGVGKSTLVNRWMGAPVQAVREIRAHDERGVHTTTARRLLRLPWGALLIDTPGLREVALAGTPGGLGSAFSDVEALAAACRFRDCAHVTEPGCAVRSAVEQGALAPDRLDAFLRLGREMAFLARKEDVHQRLAEQRRWKEVSKAARRRRRADPDA